MGRNNRKPTAILIADTHLRDGVPVCRTDDFQRAQTQKWRWLRRLQNTYGCYIFHSGDFFDSHKPSFPLLCSVASDCPEKIITVPGNHDLPGHNLKNFSRSGLAVLSSCGILFQVLKGGGPFTFETHKANGTPMMVNVFGFPWLTELGPLPKEYRRKNYINVAICHVMTFTGRIPFPGCKSPGAGTLLRKMGGYDLIVTGDNHQTFTVQDKNRVLVNPGSMLRTSAIQYAHKPCVFLWYAENNSIEQVFFPQHEDVVSREHLEKEEERDERIEAFVSRLDTTFEIGLSFEGNMKKFFQANERSDAVTKRVWNAIHGET